jgi:hypothetical protein
MADSQKIVEEGSIRVNSAPIPDDMPPIADTPAENGAKKNFQTFNQKAEGKEVKKSDLPPANDTVRQIQRYMDFLQDGDDKHVKDLDISRVDGVRGNKTNASITAVFGADATKMSDEEILSRLREKVATDPTMRKNLVEGMDVSQGTPKGREEIQNFMKEEKFDLVKTKDGTTSLDQTIDAFKEKSDKMPTAEAKPQAQPDIQHNAKAIADAQIAQKNTAAAPQPQTQPDIQKNAFNL